MKNFGIYFLCVLLASSVNLGAQEIIFFFFSNIWLAMFIGVGVGTVVKYITNKKFVFSYKPESKREEANTFAWYSFFGVFVAAFFFLIEYGTFKLWDYQYSRQIGAVLAMLVTTAIKYKIDKHIVFKV